MAPAVGIEADASPEPGTTTTDPDLGQNQDKSGQNTTILAAYTFYASEAAGQSQTIHGHNQAPVGHGGKAHVRHQLALDELTSQLLEVWLKLDESTKRTALAMFKGLVSQH